MTREKAIEYLKKADVTVYQEPKTKTAEALEMAIKALEQEPILDKIRAVINSPNRGTCDYFIVDRIEEIINEYKAESKKGAEE